MRSCTSGGVTAETAIALGAYFGQTPEFWMNAQAAYELSKELVKNGKGIRSRIRRHARDRTSGEPIARS